LKASGRLLQAKPALGAVKRSSLPFSLHANGGWLQRSRTAVRCGCAAASSVLRGRGGVG
jgi:hypothetical protein